MVSRIIQYLIIAAALTAAWPAPARADGGVVRLNERAGPFVLTVFTAPATVCVGPVDVSVMAQDAATGRPVVDARVTVSLTGEGGWTLRAEATREQAQNKLLYAALVELPSPGRWDVEVTVVRGPDSVTVATTIPVAPAPPPFVSYWPYFALPPLAIAVFGIHQRSCRRRASRR
jgi:hypothetical protein